MLNIRRFACLFMVAALALSTIVTSTLAWSSFSQNALMEALGEQSVFPVRLEKYEKPTQGALPGKPIPGAEFYLYTEDGEQIGARFFTDEDGAVAVKLKPGGYYFEETNPSRGWAYDVDSQGEEIRAYPFTVTGESKDATVVTAYNRRMTGNLVIEKTVVIPEPPAAVESLASDAAAEDLESDVAVEDLETDTTFAGIPVGVGYTVIETPCAGYITSSQNHQGTITQSGAAASFVNTRIPAA